MRQTEPEGPPKDVYAALAERARAAFASFPIPLTEATLAILLTRGAGGLGAFLRVSPRTLHRLFDRGPVGALELRTWARREVIVGLLESRTAQVEIARVVGFRSVATLQAFVRRELGVTTRGLHARNSRATPNGEEHGVGA